MNPYASHLEGRDPFAVIAETAQQLAKLVHSLDSKALDKAPAPGKWSIRQILTHLADCELVFGFRLRQTVAQDNHTVQPFDQDQWVNTFHYGDQDATQLIRAFTPIRRVNLELLQNVDRELFNKPAKHPVWGAITVGQLVIHLAAHDTNHLQQIRDRVPAV